MTREHTGKLLPLLKGKTELDFGLELGKAASVRDRFINFVETPRHCALIMDQRTNHPLHRPFCQRVKSKPVAQIICISKH